MALAEPAVREARVTLGLPARLAPLPFHKLAAGDQQAERAERAERVAVAERAARAARASAAVSTFLQPQMCPFSARVRAAP